MDSTQLKRLIDAHGPALQLFAGTWTPSPEDCVQEAFIRYAAQHPPPENSAAWLFRVTRNLAISQSRSEQRRRKHEVQAAGQRQTLFQSPHDSPIDDEQLSRIVNSLPETIRETIVARIWGELNFDEIARLAECSVSTAHRRYERGIQSMKEALQCSKTKT